MATPRRGASAKPDTKDKVVVGEYAHSFASDFVRVKGGSAPLDHWSFSRPISCVGTPARTFGQGAVPPRKSVPLLLVTTAEKQINKSNLLGIEVGHCSVQLMRRRESACAKKLHSVRTNDAPPRENESRIVAWLADCGRVRRRSLPIGRNSDGQSAIGHTLLPVADRPTGMSAYFSRSAAGKPSRSIVSHRRVPPGSGQQLGKRYKDGKINSDVTRQVGCGVGTASRHVGAAEQTQREGNRLLAHNEPPRVRTKVIAANIDRGVEEAKSGKKERRVTLAPIEVTNCEKLREGDK
uniref:Uncharacterized protein n=1 Tax=Trichuris muris TaxID=70415 RepID=A0A5S6Q3W2_TRIMR